MKKVIYVLLALFSFTLISCSEKNELPYELEGEWSLRSHLTMYAPLYFEIGENVWDFDIENEKVNVVNTADFVYIDISETGEYDLEINGNNNTISVGGFKFDYYFQDEKLYLSDKPEMDGPILEFTKNN